MRVLIIEDEEALADAMARGLRLKGMAVDVALDGPTGYDKAVLNDYDVVVLDRNLPGMHGDEVCRRLVASGSAARILRLTAARRSRDRVAGLDLGADDYLGKPFEPRELVARLRALLRRQQGAAAETSALCFNGLSIDRLTREVRVGTQRVALTSIEYKLLLALARSPGQAQSREQLNSAVQSGRYRPLDRTVDVQVARLRSKLREAAPGADWIVTVRGEGYVFVPRE
jgi:DNA-binding response OmpR family regulator